jgi:hypothetical protein
MTNIICINNTFGRLSVRLEGRTATQGKQTIYKISDARPLTCNGQPM